MCEACAKSSLTCMCTVCIVEVAGQIGVLSKRREQSAGQVCEECRNAAVWSLSMEKACRASGWSR